jgi:hypothetical protein
MSNRNQLAHLRQIDAAQAARLPVDHLALRPSYALKEKEAA